VKKLLVVIQIVNGPDYRALLGQDVAYCPFSEAERAVEGMDVALVIVECGGNADLSIGLLRSLKKAHPSIPVVFVVETSSEEIALQAYKAGVRDYFRLPLDNDEFVRAVSRILGLRHYFQAGWVVARPTDDWCDPGWKRSASTVQERLARAVEYVENNCSESLSLEEVARVACMSKYHFCRVFKKQFGIGPMQYLMGLRIKKTISLLTGSDLPVTLIALKAGFSDVSQFNKQFKKVTGLTPTAFRKEHTAHS
jgi:AraC-like DNA-binding protein/CheY-like chemotaxis protein